MDCLKENRGNLRLQLAIAQVCVKIGNETMVNVFRNEWLNHSKPYIVPLASRERSSKIFTKPLADFSFKRDIAFIHIIGLFDELDDKSNALLDKYCHSDSACVRRYAEKVKKEIRNKRKD